MIPRTVDLNVIDAILMDIKRQGRLRTIRDGLSYGSRTLGRIIMVNITPIADFAIKDVIGDSPIQKDVICCNGLLSDRVGRIDLLQYVVDAVESVLRILDKCFSSVFTEAVEEISQVKKAGTIM